MWVGAARQTERALLCLLRALRVCFPRLHSAKMSPPLPSACLQTRAVLLRPIRRSLQARLGRRVPRLEGDVVALGIPIGLRVIPRRVRVRLGAGGQLDAVARLYGYRGALERGANANGLDHAVLELHQLGV